MLKGEGGTEPEHVSAAAGGEDFGLIRFDGGEQDDRVMNKLKRRGKKKGEAERVRPVQREKRLEGAITRDKQETKQDVARLEDSLRSPFLFSCDDDENDDGMGKGQSKKGRKSKRQFAKRVIRAPHPLRESKGKFAQEIFYRLSTRTRADERGTNG